MNRRGFLSGLVAVAAVAAVPIVWAARKLGFVNVKDFGAIGDGVTDDRAAFESALNAVSDGGTIYVPPGEYNLRGGMPLLKGQIIVGGGVSETVINVGSKSPVVTAQRAPLVIVPLTD